MTGAPIYKPRGYIFPCWARSFPPEIPYWHGASERQPWHFPDSIEMELGNSWTDNSLSEVLRVTAHSTVRKSLRSADSDQMFGNLYLCASQIGGEVKG